MNSADLLHQHRDQVVEIAARHGVVKVSVFGSIARGETHDKSDIDLLIDVDGPTTPWFPGGLVAELEDLLGCRVDVAERRSLNPLIKDAILSEARPL